MDLKEQAKEILEDAIEAVKYAELDLVEWQDRIEQAKHDLDVARDGEIRAAKYLVDNRILLLEIVNEIQAEIGN